ncbi:MAG: carbohydrate-binding domain-containing protein [Lachnospiraceae bacterium]|nr:carbohydrate-binding domain-containing protein [Lachnospiraceae bacterium]
MAVCILSAASVTACANKETVNTNAVNENSSDTNVISDVTADESGLFSKRDLSGAFDASKCENITLSDAGCTTDSKNVTIDGSKVTITGEGDYMVNGSLSDGMLIVDVDKTQKVQLVLNGVDINAVTSAAVYVKSADKVFITLPDRTENTLTNGGSFVAIDDNNIDAVIFSKDDLTLNGTGTLTINSPAGHGVVSKNDLVITGGTYDITAASHGMTGKDSVAVADGDFRITAGEDAIKSDNNDDDTMGSVYILGGNYALTGESDGINALNEINISGGNIVVGQAEEGLEARIINISGGTVDINASDDGVNATDKRVSTNEQMAGGQDEEDKKGHIGGMGDNEPDASINISGGVLRVNAEGDGLDSNGYITVSGGEVYVTGPTHGGDAAIDYGIDAVVSGGIVVAAGQGNMAQNFGTDSTQGAILVNTQAQNEAGSDIVLLDNNGSELLAWTAQKSYNSVTISCPEIKADGTYTVKMGENTTDVTMNGLIYGQGVSFGGGRRGLGGGEKPEGMPERSDFPNGERPEGMPNPPDFPNGEKMDGKRPEGMPELPDFQNKDNSDGAEQHTGNVPKTEEEIRQ